MSSSRLPALDFGRGMAALAVVIFHYTFLNEAARLGMPGLAKFTNYGYLGVHFFFLISGFVIFMTLEKTAGAWDFFVARASRLYPAFVLSIILTIFFLYMLQGHVMFSTKDILLNLTMFPGSLGATKINPAYWTLSFEIIFYGIVFLAILSRGKNGVMPIIIAWFSLSALNAFIDLGVIEKLLILKWSPLFTGGAALYLATCNTGKARAIYLVLFFTTLPFACYYTLENLVESRALFDFWQTQDNTLIALITSIYLLMALIAFRPNAMNWLPPKFIEICGGGSYILYLIHERVGNEVITQLYPSIGNAGVFLTITLMIAASAFLYVYFDKPAQRKLRILRTQVKTTPNEAPASVSN